MAGFEVPKPHEVWIFRCTKCGWHSDINPKQVHTCPSCNAEVIYMNGTSAEIGNYLKRLMLWEI